MRPQSTGMSSANYETRDSFAAAPNCTNLHRMRILSLDFDGVLHPSPRHLPLQNVAVFAWLDHLVPLLDAHPDVGLLVHSSWRETYSANEIQDMLHPMEHRFVGVAPAGERVESIARWRNDHAPQSRILVIDDDRELLAVPGVAVLHCDPRFGLSDLAVQRTIKEWLERVDT